MEEDWDAEEEEEARRRKRRRRRRRRTSADIKSNNPHLTGGEVKTKAEGQGVARSMETLRERVM